MSTPFKIVCFGDSITGPEPRTRYLDKYVKFADLLGLMLEGRLGADASLVLNRGCGGDTSVGALERLKQDVLDEHPDIAVVLIGANDAETPGIGPDVTLPNIIRIFDETLRAGIRVLALEYHVLPNEYDPTDGWKELARCNDLIAEAAAQFAIPVAPIRSWMDRALETYSMAELLCPSDGIHLNFAGEMVHARAIFHTLDTLGWLERLDAGHGKMTI